MCRNCFGITRFSFCKRVRSCMVHPHYAHSQPYQARIRFGWYSARPWQSILKVCGGILQHPSFAMSPPSVHSNQVPCSCCINMGHTSWNRGVYRRALSSNSYRKCGMFWAIEFTVQPWRVCDSENRRCTTEVELMLLNTWLFPAAKEPRSDLAWTAISVLYFVTNLWAVEQVEHGASWIQDVAVGFRQAIH